MSSSRSSLDGPEMEPGEADVPTAEIYESDLDGPLFEALMDDIDRFSEVLGVMLKSDAEERAEEGMVSLDQARLLLLLGKTRGVQIHYRHQGVTWVDTLIRRSTSIHLVRMKTDLGEPSLSKKRLPIVQ